MNAVKSRVVRAAASHIQTSNIPSLDQITRLSERRRTRLGSTLIETTIRKDRKAVSTTTLDATLAERSTVRFAGVKAGTEEYTFAPLGSTASLLAPPVANATARTTMLRVRDEICAHTITSRSLGARQRQVDVFADSVCGLIVEFRPKHPNRVHPLELYGIGLVHRVPRQRDRVRTFLPRSYERAVPDYSRLVRQRSTDDVVYSIRIREHDSEGYGFPGGDLRDICLQTENHRRSFDGSGVASRGRIPGITRLRRPGSYCIFARICARGHGCGHRGHGRHRRRRRLVVPTASQKDSPRKRELPLCSHAPSLPRDEDACNRGNRS
jgi:hypothetical protein